MTKGADKNITLAQLIRYRAEHSPTKIYLETTLGERWSFGEVHEASIRYANALRKMGVTPFSQVAVMLPTGVDGTLMWIACSWLRAARVAIHVDAAFEGLPLQQVLSNCQAKVIVVGAKYLEKLSRIDLSATLLETAIVIDEVSSTAARVDIPLTLVNRADFLCDCPTDEPDRPRYNAVASIT